MIITKKNSLVLLEDTKYETVEQALRYSFTTYCKRQFSKDFIDKYHESIDYSYLGECSIITDESLNMVISKVESNKENNYRNDNLWDFTKGLMYNKGLTEELYDKYSNKLFSKYIPRYLHDRKLSDWFIEKYMAKASCYFMYCKQGKKEISKPIYEKYRTQFEFVQLWLDLIKDNAFRFKEEFWSGDTARIFFRYNTSSSDVHETLKLTCREDGTFIVTYLYYDHRSMGYPADIKIESDILHNKEDLEKLMLKWIYEEKIEWKAERNGFNPRNILSLSKLNFENENIEKLEKAKMFEKIIECKVKERDEISAEIRKMRSQVKRLKK